MYKPVLTHLYKLSLKQWSLFWDIVLRFLKWLIVQTLKAPHNACTYAYLIRALTTFVHFGVKGTKNPMRIEAFNYQGTIIDKCGL